MSFRSRPRTSVLLLRPTSTSFTLAQLSARICIRRKHLSRSSRRRWRYASNSLLLSGPLRFGLLLLDLLLFGPLLAVAFLACLSRSTYRLVRLVARFIFTESLHAPATGFDEDSGATSASGQSLATLNTRRRRGNAISGDRTIEGPIGGFYCFYRFSEAGSLMNSIKSQGRKGVGTGPNARSREHVDLSSTDKKRRPFASTSSAKFTSGLLPSRCCSSTVSNRSKSR